MVTGQMVISMVSVRLADAYLLYNVKNFVNYVACFSVQNSTCYFFPI